MINSEEFRKYGRQFVDWMADFYQNIEDYPVKSQVKPGEILNAIPAELPEESETMDEIFADFKAKILPGMTHWQHPNFHAYFPANTSYPSVLAEMLTAALGAQCMIWETSPAATELEEKMMEWLKQLCGLPEAWHGVIQDTASAATLVAILTAREFYSNYKSNKEGVSQKVSVYCSAETHSSADKAVRIAGIGADNLVKIPVDHNGAMIRAKLQEAIERDQAKGLKPICVIATIGTTGITAIDPIEEIGELCKRFNIWMHVDAAYAGTALVLPEWRWMIKGIEYADSYVFNPHKWMFTNFDCTAYFVKDKEALIKTFEILPEYLKTDTRGKVIDYRDWGVPLGRRFRALKLWFVLRNFGAGGIRNIIKKHIHLAQYLERTISGDPAFEVMIPAKLNMICFRYRPSGMEESLYDQLNERLLKAINDSGKAYLTHTRYRGHYVLRLVIGQTYVEQKHVDKIWRIIKEKSELLMQTDYEY